MDDAVTVFVDDSVLGRLPSICVKDGVVTGDRVTQRIEVGSQDLGISWLLIFLGPIGWVILVAMFLNRQPAEVLRVVLPLSDAAWQREGRARRAYRGFLALAAFGGIGVIISIATRSRGAPAVLLLVAIAAVATLVGGIIGMTRAHQMLNHATVDLELDASRRWVTIWRAHPDFVAASNHQWESALEH